MSEANEGALCATSFSEDQPLAGGIEILRAQLGHCHRGPSCCPFFRGVATPGHLAE